MKSRWYRKQRKKYIDQLINIIENSTEYQEYINTDERYKELVENSKKLQFWRISFYDSYSNKDMNRLVKSFSNLDKEKYKVDLYYRVKKFKNLNYFSLQYSQSRTSILAKVDFLSDNYIKRISSSFTQVNNNQAVVEFNVEFNKIMDYSKFLEFIKANKKQLYQKKFIGYYDIHNSINTIGYSEIHRMFDELVTLSLQAKLLEIAELNFGLNYKLPSLMVINYPDGLYDKESLRNVFLCTTIEIRNGEQHIITDITEHDGLKMELFFSGRSYSPLSLITLLSNYRMNFYYFLFERIELNELNLRMNKYFVESKKSISSSDYRWLVNKIRAINDNKLFLSYKTTDNRLVKEWKFIYDGKEREPDFLTNKFVEKYTTVYTECLEHIKILYAVGKENLIIRVATWTLIATLIGVGITIYSNYK